MHRSFEPIPKKSRVIKTDKPRPYLCPVCTRGFVRQEHLKRHQRSHTRERPFLCILCGRCFARKDLVIRHQQKLHAAAVPNNDFERIIVNVVGNQETILPTPESAALARQISVQWPAQEGAVASLPSSISGPGQMGPPAPHLRHASFSAATGQTYVPPGFIPGTSAPNGTVDDLGVGMPAAPMQVGFSTPQFTGQQVLDRAVAAGLLDANDALPGNSTAITGGDPNADVDPLELPPAMQKSQSEPLKNINSMFSNSSAFLASLPSLADMLTVSGTASGISAATPQEMRRNPFDYSAELDNLVVTPDSHGNSNVNGSVPMTRPADSVMAASNSMGTAPSNDTAASSAADPWLSEFLDMKNFPPEMQLNNIGFVDNSSTPSSNDDGRHDSISQQILGLFSSRQQDIYNNTNLYIPDGDPELPLTFDFTHKPKPTHENTSPTLNYFTEELRDFIIKDHDLNSNSFPSVKDLNAYIVMYDHQFTEYYPFVHLWTLKATEESYPLFLAIATIGALYTFHSTHSKILSMVCSRKIKSFLFQNEQHTPLWVIQTLTLLTFYNIFNNNLHMTKQMAAQLTTLLNLIRSNKLNLPLELSVQPPIPNDQFMKYEHDPQELRGMMDRLNSPEQQKKNFEYFVLAQQRIRVCHMVHMLSTLYAAMIGVRYSLHAIELKCGIPTYYRELFEAKDYVEWSSILKNKLAITLDSKFSLIQLSNGGESYESYLMYLSNGYNGNSKLFQKKVSKLTLFSLVLSIHEKISFERKRAKDNNVDWKVTSRSTIDSMIKYWEILYLRNGGTLVTNEATLPIMDNDSMSRLIVPMYCFLKTRRCVDFSQIVRKVWVKDWSSMNKLLEDVTDDWTHFREATEAGLSMIESWINIVSSISTIPNEMKKNHGYKTPVFTITCIFTSVLLISEYLMHIEKWAQNHKDDSSPPELSYKDKLLYFKSANLMKKIQDTLLPKDLDKIKASYVDFLQMQVNENDDSNGLLTTPPSHETDAIETIMLIQKMSLSSKALYLGVKILSDAPIWPIALLFAHGFQSRAIYNVSNGLVDM